MDKPLVNWPISLNLTGDITPISKSIANLLVECPKAAKRLCSLIPWCLCPEKMREVLLSKAQTEADVEAIQSAQKRYENHVTMDVLPSVAVNDPVALVDVTNRREETVNFLKAVQETAELLRSVRDQDVSDDPMQKTFFNRWRKEVELVDEEGLRNLWARIMAQEVVKPKSISLHTLDVVRSLSEHEASVFSRVVAGELGGAIPAKDSKLAFGNFDDILELQDSGLMNPQHLMHGLAYKLTQNGQDTASIQLIEDSGFVLKVSKSFYQYFCYPLTRAGRDLLNVALKRRTLEEVKEIAMFLSKSNPELIFTLHNHTGGAGDQIKWDEVPVWSSKSILHSNVSQ